MIKFLSFQKSYLKFLDIEVNSISSIMKRGGDVFFIPHKTDFYKIFFFDETIEEIEVEIDFKKYKLLPNTILFISKESVYWFDKKNDLKGKVILFSADFVHSTTSILEPLVILKLMYSDWQKSIISIIDLLYIEYQSESKSNKICEYLLNSLFLYMEKSTKSNNTQNSVSHKFDYDLYFKFCEYVDENYSERKHINDYAILLGVSERKLQRITKKYALKTPLKIIEDRVVLEAKRLLSYSNLRNNEIASKLGFYDDSYFVKFFKKHEKMTPKEFQNKINDLQK